MGTSIGAIESVSLIPESNGYAPSLSGLLTCDESLQPTVIKKTMA